MKDNRNGRGMLSEPPRVLDQNQRQRFKYLRRTEGRGAAQDFRQNVAKEKGIALPPPRQQVDRVSGDFSGLRSPTPSMAARPQMSHQFQPRPGAYPAPAAQPAPPPPMQRGTALGFPGGQLPNAPGYRPGNAASNLQQGWSMAEYLRNRAAGMGGALPQDQPTGGQIPPTPRTDGPQGPTYDLGMGMPQGQQSDLPPHLDPRLTPAQLRPGQTPSDPRFRRNGLL